MSLLDTIKKMFGAADKKLKWISEYYDNRKLEYAYSVDEDGNKQGPYEEYRYNGQLWKKCTYKDGEKDGPYEEYYDNGQLYEKCTYKNGRHDGPYEMYHKNGRLKIKCTYKDGKLDGPYEKYYENGQLQRTCTYKDGKKDGPYACYWSNGQLLAKCTFKDGKEDGPYEYYYESGLLEEKRVYRMGKWLSGKKAEEYLKEWRKDEKTARTELNVRLAQMDRQMLPTYLRRSFKRAEVAKFRAKFPNKKDGR